MKQIIATLFGLYTQAELDQARYDLANDKRKLFFKAMRALQERGRIPPNMDLKLPKNRIIIKDEDGKYVIAEKGKWERLPRDGEKVVITYE